MRIWKQNIIAIVWLVLKAFIVKPILMNALQILVKMELFVRTRSIGTIAFVWLGTRGLIVKRILTNALPIHVKMMARALIW